MIVHLPQLHRTGDTVRIEAEIEHGAGHDRIWFEMPGAYEPFVTLDKVDGFLVAALPLAMKLGEDIHLDGPVSALLLENLQRRYVRILSLVAPYLQRIEIHASSLDHGEARSCAGETGTGFSGGIDSFCVLVDYLAESVPPRDRVTRLAFSNVWAHMASTPEQARRQFEDQLAKVVGFPKEMGLGLLEVDSNLAAVLDMNFRQTHVLRNLAPILLLQGLFRRYLYASCFKYEDCYAGEAVDVAFADPFAIHLLSTETLQMVSSGCEYTRVEKTRKVSQYQPARRYLTVCTNVDADGVNCSKCRKCGRTMFTLELLGALDRFSEVFDLSLWPASRKKYLVRLLAERSDPFRAEVLALAREVGFQFPLSSRIRGRWRGVRRAIARREPT